MVRPAGFFEETSGLVYLMPTTSRTDPVLLRYIAEFLIRDKRLDQERCKGPIIVNRHLAFLAAFHEPTATLPGKLLRSYNMIG